MSIKVGFIGNMRRNVVGILLQRSRFEDRWFILFMVDFHLGAKSESRLHIGFTGPIRIPNKSSFVIKRAKPFAGSTD